ncbi:MAG: CHAT domain-containing protein [Gemmatimonadota bacterium]
MRSFGRPAFILVAVACLFRPAVSEAQERSPAALLTTADSLYAERAYPAAAEVFAKVLSAAETAESPDLVHRGLIGLATTYRLTGRVAESLVLLERARDLARRSGDRTHELDALRGLGISRHDLGRHAIALEAYDAALALARELGDARAEGVLWNNMGSVLYRQGDYAGAIEALERSLALIPADSPDYIRVLTNIGRAHMYRGEYATAHDLYEEARERARRFDDPHLDGLIWNRFAVLYDRTGQNDRAWEANVRALEISRAIGLRQGESADLENLGILRKKAGDLDGALTYLEQARAIQEEDGDDTGAGTTLKLIADVHRLRGDLAQARDTYREALAIDLRAGQRGQAGLSRLGLSDALLALGEGEAALAQADTALASAREIHHPDLAGQAGYRRARALRALGRQEEALAALVSATRRIETLRAALASDPAKIGFLEERQRPFHEMVDLLIELGRPLDALVVAERGRARALVDLLAGRVSPSAGEGATRLARVRAAEAELRDAITMPDSSGGTGPESLLALRAAGALEAELGALVEEDEELASLVSAQSVSAAEILGLARTQEATLVEYLVAEDRLTIWVVAPDGSVQARVEPVGRDSIRAAVGRVRTAWEKGLAAGLGPETMALDQLAALHSRLISPIESWLPVDPESVMYVLPHDALYLLPFAALRDSDGSYLVERHTISHAPSISVLGWLAEGRMTADEAAAELTAEGDSAPPQGDWLGVGDPAVAAETGLDRLPWAAYEVRKVAERFAAEKRVVLMGAAATEAALRKLAPAQDVIHFAGHGVISDREPLASALLLAPGDGQDGYLRTPEIFALDLDADLVVLSGCSTGLGKLTGDGVLGLSRAFLYAGTPAVIVSQWDVSDRATAELMDHFYAVYRAGSARGAAHALRAAQRTLLERYPHPYLWAAFELIGSAR